MRYRFDYAFGAHEAGGRSLYELGRNDVGVPIVVDPGTGNVFFLDGGTLSFINSSFEQMIESFKAVNEWGIPDHLPDDERAALFAGRMLGIDPDCFRDEEACWSTVRGEILNGVI